MTGNGGVQAPTTDAGGKPLARAFEQVPPESALAMPEQDFGARPDLIARRPLNIDIWARRLLVVLLALLPAAMAAHEMRRSIGLDGISAWEGVYLALFIPLFAWIAFGFATAMIGFLLLTVGKGRSVTPRPLNAATPLKGKTAILLPVCNEDFLGVLGRLSIMERSLAQVMGGERFEFFILSDSNPESGEIERRAFQEMRASFSRPVHYRRRALNIGRKPGNIAEWVQRFGGGYDYMVVLDADSVVSGQTMARLAADMERHPHVGLIQTVPTVMGAATLFARWQQFASRLFGPTSAAGMIWWAGSEGMFWGHNAIVRVSAFAESCGLPELPGRAPFGGHILSHDMLEAALLRRRGWDVHMVTADDSFEEFPPSMPDLFTRDRRWCQGNIQHVPLLVKIKGLHPVSRFQLLVGASAYCTSPLWLALMLVVLGGALTGVWPPSAILPSGGLLALTAVLLFGPKLLAIIWAMADPARRIGFGGAARMTRGVLVDIILSILMAPVAMLTQTINLFSILMGRKASWNGQTRDRDGMAMTSAIWLFKWHLLLGAGLTTMAVKVGSLGWMSPVVAGLFAAPVLAALTARKDLGRKAEENGLFQVADPWWRTQSYRPLRFRWPSTDGRRVGPLAANDE
ncbi:glucans biosynthesis glucosyltransferase MdoH [Sphingobium sp. AR-3-1]|uniref:Glucans biosynthesis glucosyltransferase H n=1 Tax=Sphingobium psychrophilum TaxID=2728834 RepID=A0A7X9WRV6_9SPHN|nr:glucans biosynthesis glucosyltransferase MdoH [Sphingobium psychrophilum]NML08759.1 glucans biosynthesis glucosyltransferase MdoH [Sphingobium psychrophilum]